MHRRLAAVLALLCTLSFAGGGIAAQEASPAASPVASPVGTSKLTIPVDEPVAGLSQGEWSARQWQWLVSFPNEASPNADQTGARCGLGQSGPVFFLAGLVGPGPAERACTVPAGVAILLPVFGAECSTLEPPPFFGRDEAELAACAAAAADTLPDPARMEVLVDGQALGDLGRFRVATPVFTLALPEDNVFGTPAGVGSAVGDGYFIMLAPLPPVEHVVELGPLVSLTYRLTVVAPTVVEPGT